LKFNIIGFWDKPQSRWTPTKSCPYHHSILIPKRNEKGEYEPGVLWCRECGWQYLEKDAATEETVKGKYKKQQTGIIQGKKKRKFYDSKGNLITDETLIQDLLQGKNIISYNETKSGSDKPVVVKK
jgi:DNA-directed RNA polymerase subunit M/transcription elongation factor TFIIS